MPTCAKLKFAHLGIPPLVASRHETAATLRQSYVPSYTVKPLIYKAREQSSLGFAPVGRYFDLDRLLGADMIDWLAGALGVLKTWAQSEQVVAAFGSAIAGAWFGAWAARKGAAADKARDTMLAELRACYLVGTLSFSFANRALSMKKQHIKGLCEKFKAQRLEMEKLYNARLPPPDRVITEFDNFPALDIPTDLVRDTVLEKTSLWARPLSCSLSLQNSARAYEEANAERNEIIEQSKRDGGMLLLHYFGFPDERGQVNKVYPDILEIMSETLDDVIFFSWQLGEDVMEHAEELARAYKKRFGNAGLQSIAKVNLKDAEDAGLMPGKAKYESWLGGFAKTKKETRWDRLRAAGKKFRAILESKFW